MHTELSLDANEALSLASMVRQSCPTARLRGATRIQNRKLWREYGRRPFGLQLASMARSRGVACGCSYVHCRETHVRLTSDGGEANEMLLFHGTGATKPKARAELGGATAVGCSENVYCSSARREGLMWEVQARVSLAHRLGLGCPCVRDCKCDAVCGAAALKRRGDEGGRGLAVGRAICEVESLQPMRSSRWSRCCSTAMPEARGSPDWR